MVKGQKEKIKNKSFYIWMLSGALAVICICAVCLNISGLNNKAEKGPSLNEPIVQELAEDQNPEDTQLADAQGADEVNLLENDITDDGADASRTTQEEPAVASKEPEPEVVSVMGNSDTILDSLNFNEEAGLTWPVSGNVILPYNENPRIWFATLGQYKCNESIIIGVEEGSKVVSAAKGVVTKIYENEETGVTLEMSIGDDYKLTYGQLKDLAVEEGDSVTEGQLIGCIAKPSKYYSVEGSNLYFQVSQADKSVNPMFLLQ